MSIVSDDPNSLNPYQPSGNPYASDEAPVDQRFVSGYVRELARWQLFFAVLASLGALLFLGTTVIRVIMESDPATLVTGLICPFLFVLLFFVTPAIQLGKAVVAASRYANTGSSTHLSEFASSQLAFWRTAGILSAGMLVLFTLIMIVALFSRSVGVNVGN